MKHSSKYFPILTIGLCFSITSCANDLYIASGINDKVKLVEYVEPMQLKSLEKTFDSLPVAVQSAVENSALTIVSKQKTQLSEISDFIANTNPESIEEIVQNSADELIDVVEESLHFAKKNAHKQTPQQIQQHIVNSASPKVWHIQFRLKQQLNNVENEKQ